MCPPLLQYSRGKYVEIEQHSNNTKGEQSRSSFKEMLSINEVHDYAAKGLSRTGLGGKG